MYWQGPTEGAHTLRWHGTAAFTLEHQQRVLAFDPYVTRHSLWQLLSGPLEINEPLLQREFPRADAVLVGHAHYDHALEAPSVCARTGATLYGSPSTANLARAAGLPESQIVTVTPGEPVELVHGRAVGLPSRHGKVYFGRVTLPGNIESPPPWPPRMRDMRHGQVLTWWAEWGGLKIVHVDSADYETAALAPYDADVLCLCAIGRKYRPGYTSEIIRALKPKLVVPCHWDHFFLPLDHPTRQLPACDVEGFIEEIRAEGVEVALLPIGGSVGL
jgi:L-ascorbate metabolism protein UlaG (beta-lactamase superfamily)